MILFLGFILQAQSSFYTIPMYYGSYYKDFNATTNLSYAFYWSSSIHISSTLDLWISSPIDHTITSIMASTYTAPKAEVISITGQKGQANYRDGDLSTALLNTPKSLYYYKEKVYVADMNNHCIRVIDVLVKSIRQFTGTCGKPGFKDGPAMYNRLNKPDLVGAVNDTLIINDSGNNYIRIVNISTGVMSTLWGGACRDVSNYTEETHKPEYRVEDSVFYNDNGSIHKMVCDLNLVKTFGEPSEHLFSMGQITQPCSSHYTLCVNRTHPLVIRKYVLNSTI